MKLRAAPPTRRLMQFALLDPAPLLYGNEPIWRGDAIVGRVTSGAYGHTFGAAIGLGYVSHSEGVTPAFAAAAGFEIEIAGRRVAARASLTPMYDPGNARIRV